MKSIVTITFSVLVLAACNNPHGPQAHIVSKDVGPPLREAQALVAAKNYKAALVKVNEAEAAKSTADDAYVIGQFKQLIEACENRGCPSQP